MYCTRLCSNSKFTKGEVTGFYIAVIDPNFMLTKNGIFPQSFAVELHFFWSKFLKINSIENSRGTVQKEDPLPCYEFKRRTVVIENVQYALAHAQAVQRL